MTAWHDGPLAPFDLETTGVDTASDRIVTACVARVGRGIGAATRVWLVNPGIPIPAGATAIHGITDEQAQQGKPATEAVDEIAVELVSAQLSGAPIVGWNVSYDLSLLAEELDRYGLPSLDDRLGRPVGPVIDGLVLDKHVDRYRRGSRKLVDAARHYAIDLSEIDAHGAEADALAAARIVWRIASRYPAIAEASLFALHEQQVEWAAEQDASFRAHRERTGNPITDPPRTWPLTRVGAAA